MSNSVLQDLDCEHIKWSTGGCGILALQLHDLTGWPLLGFYHDEERAEPGFDEFPSPYHVAVLHPNGQSLDARGLCKVHADAEALTIGHLHDLFAGEHLPGPWTDFDHGVDIYHDVADMAHCLLTQAGFYASTV